MGCCTSSKENDNVSQTKNQLENNKTLNYETENENDEPHFIKRRSRLIPYSDDDPIDKKIEKIHIRWAMTFQNIIEYMSILKFDSILQISIKNHLPPNNNIIYESNQHLMDILIENNINKSIFCQYWKMEKYISSKQILQRHVNLIFKFKKWKVEEQLSYVNDSDLQLFETYNPIINTKTIIANHMNMGDILVVLTPRWHQTHNNNNNNITNGNDDSIVKVDSFTPFTMNNKKPNTNSNNNNNIKNTNGFKLKLFPIKSPMSASDETTHTNTHSKEQSTSPYNAIYSDNEDNICDNNNNNNNNNIIPIKLTDFQKYITLQAMCLAVTISERELLTIKTQSKLQSVTLNKNINNNNNLQLYKPIKKLTDLQEDEANEINVIHHDNKQKYNRFYFTLCTDRTSALLKVQELVIKINKIVDDLSFLYSIVKQASNNNLSPAQYIQSIKQVDNKHLLSLSGMEEASFINICGGLAKYWSDIDDNRSIIKRVQSALQFSALGSVFMYPKDYAARTKWKIGDPVMIFKQNISKWCPGKITKLYPKKDNIEVKYAVLYHNNNENKNIIPPPLIQGNEDEDDNNNNNNNETSQSFNDIQINNLNRPNSQKFADNKDLNDISNKRLPKVTFVSNVMSNDSVRGSISDYIAPFSPTQQGSNETTPISPKGNITNNGTNHAKGSLSRSSRIDIMDASKLAKIDFVNDTTLEVITLNRYDRDFVRPMIIKNQKRASLSVTIDNKGNRTSELLDMLTGLGNATGLNDRLQSICNDEELIGIIAIDNDENIYKNIENENKPKKRNKNIHPIALMLVEIDQLSSKVNLNNRQSDMIKNQNKYSEEKYNEDFIMLRVSKVLDNIGKNFNKYLSTSQSQNGSDHDINSLLESQHSRTDSFLTQNISLNDGNGKRNNNIRIEAFRYGHNIFALLLHNTDVAKSLVISRFIQKEIKYLCHITTEFKYDEYYLTVSMAIANLHYDVIKTKIIDSYRSWYKRCSDALKTIRYEGGNGVTHADVLFGVQQATPIQSPQNSGPLEIGILHTAGSATSEPGIAMQFQNSLNENYFKDLNSFHNNLIQEDIYNQYKSPQSNPQQQPPPQINLSPSYTAMEPMPNSVGPPEQQLQSPISQSDTNNKTVTWIGRLDRKYTFV